MATVPTTFDPLFARYGAPYGIPLQFLRALAWMESGLDPTNVTGGHIGLFQPGKENLDDWDKAAKSAGYPIPAGSWRVRLTDPALNTRVFVRTLNSMMSSFKAGGLTPDWSWDDYPALLTMGWNAGWSQKQGVRRVLDYLRGKGLPLDYSTVAAWALDAGAKSTLSDGAKQQWQRATVALFRHLETSPALPIPATVAARLQAVKAALPGRVGDWGWLALLLGIIYLTDIKKW